MPIKLDCVHYIPTQCYDGKRCRAWCGNSTEASWGSFKLSINKFEQCKGPKRLDCCVASGEIINGSTIVYDIIVQQNVSPTKGKIVAMTKDKQFLRLQMKKPCEHLFLRPLFHTMLNVSKNCVIMKGHYNFKIDIQEVAQKYYDGSFLFGHWTFKSIFYNDECNFSCTVVEVEFSPKNKTS
ncbi:uncharacterized protein LOC115443919 [Manduca sexta]|uniref:uncharacterized protein LOC115443919 n=1 Tax=Manduca sexta TaxID=7130 RepID=UPI0018906AD1|nr:uncharacterized protein LOC115443919 [Manduca sexta]